MYGSQCRYLIPTAAYTLPNTDTDTDPALTLPSLIMAVHSLPTLRARPLTPPCQRFSGEVESRSIGDILRLSNLDVGGTVFDDRCERAIF